MPCRLHFHAWWCAKGAHSLIDVCRQEGKKGAIPGHLTIDSHGGERGVGIASGASPENAYSLVLPQITANALCTSSWDPDILVDVCTMLLSGLGVYQRNSS